MTVQQEKEYTIFPLPDFQTDIYVCVKLRHRKTDLCLLLPALPVKLIIHALAG